MKTHIQARSWKEAERLGVVPGVTACGRYDPHTRGRVIITPTDVSLAQALAFPQRVTCDDCRAVAALGEATAVVEHAKAA